MLQPWPLGVVQSMRGQMQALTADGEFRQTPPLCLYHLSWFLCHSIHVIGFDSSIWPEYTS